MSRFRWWLVGVVLLVVVAAAVAAVLIVVGRKVEGRPQAASLPGLPAQTLLASSMRKQPVPGWKVTVKQLGLPPGTAVKPLRNVGERGYFLGITAKGWWLVGVDLGRGQRLFAPVPIGTAENALSIDCFVNGPAMVLCIREDRDPNRPARTSVVDAEKGTLVFDGESDLRTSPAADHPTLWQVGDYVVAEVCFPRFLGDFRTRFDRASLEEGSLQWPRTGSTPMSCVYARCGCIGSLIPSR